MIEVLEFVFRDFQTYLGVALLLCLVFKPIRITIKSKE